jgi:glycosyltransferase involved in cell wall biosynthesis
MRFSIVTPTYNRAHLLPRVYDSLCSQTLHDIEWIVVDDGSSDGTPTLVAQIAANAPFPVKYVWQANAGKHVALNRGMREVNGFFVGILDSDDAYSNDALERCWALWESIPSTRRSIFAGITALVASPDGQIVGKRYPADVLDSDSIEIRTEYCITGDKRGFLRAEVLREFPFPEDLGKFVTEGLIWNRMALRYKTRFVNEVWGLADYQLDGLSAGGEQLRANSPLAARLYYQELLASGRRLPLRVAFRTSANVIRYSLHASGRLPPWHTSSVPGVPRLVAAGAGFALYIRDKLSQR